jgi:hypothetical protein|tara:strand:- start:97 stop:270 length:174 start_codon:yes stop_codon:yes gene_type:complete
MSDEQLPEHDPSGEWCVTCLETTTHMELGSSGPDLNRDDMAEGRVLECIWCGTHTVL